MKKILGSLAVFTTLAAGFGGFGTEAFAQSNRSLPKPRCVHRLSNQTPYRLNFDVNGHNHFLSPGQSKTFFGCSSGGPRPNLKPTRSRIFGPLVTYDSMIGPGYVVRRSRLRSGENIFVNRGRRITLIKHGGPRPNFKPVSAK